MASKMFQAYPSIGNKPRAQGTGSSCDTSSGDSGSAEQWVAVPKLHGSNMQFDVQAEAEKEQGEVAAANVDDAAFTRIRVGRRNGYLGRNHLGTVTNPLDDDHYGSKDAVRHDGINAKLIHLSQSLDGTRFIAYAEVYGGQYGPLSHPGQARKPVQKHVWYTKTVRLAFFDLWVEGRGFLPFDEARPIMTAVGLPVLPAAHRGSFDEVLAWARAHATDNATAYWNPEELPPLDNNAGEGFVIRPAAVERTSVHGERVMFKIKNPKFEEIAHGKGTGGEDTGKGEHVSVACPCSGCLEGVRDIMKAKAICPARVDAVFSKEAESMLTKDNLRVLAQKVLDDVQVEVEAEGWWPKPHDGTCKALDTLRSAACKEVNVALNKRVE